MTDNMRSVMLMNVAMAMFTLNDAAMKAVLQTLPLFQTIALRGILTTAGLLGIAAATGALALRLPRGDRGLLGLRALGEIAATLAFLAALSHMPIANLSAIMQVVPLAVTLAAALFFGEKVGWRRMSAIAVGFSGVLLIVQPDSRGFDVWSLLGLVSVAFVVLRDLTTRRISRAVPSVVVAVLTSLAVMTMGLVGMVAEGWHPLALREAVLILLAAGALIVGYLTVVATMRIGDIGVVAPFRYMALIWAIVLGWAAFDEFPDMMTLTGSALVVGSGLFTVLRERRLRGAGPR
ncbi:DMT family transporter [Neotabrizicola sp. VNH66]|uniref:DMT family transporter n=1 Tax=Neotabrizicola sp. VNH66 TaxID=3400918 RepID=UPI003C0C5769